MVWIVAWEVVGRFVEVVEGGSRIGWEKNFLKKVKMIYFLNRNF
jgi:hypothetical protein